MRFKKWNIGTPAERDVALLRSAGYPYLLSTVLAARGVTTAEAAAEALERDRSLSMSPMLMRDMDKAVARIQRAISQGETIAVFGDYDVDGITSTVLLMDYLKSCGVRCLRHIPRRIEEGYGLSKEAIQGLRDQGATLMITVDCGITAGAETAFAASLGVDVVVTDQVQSPGRVVLTAVWDPAEEELVPASEADLEGPEKSYLSYNQDSQSVWLTIAKDSGERDCFQMEDNGFRFESLWHFELEYDDWGDPLYYVNGLKCDLEEWTLALAQADQEAGSPVTEGLLPLDPETVKQAVDCSPGEELPLWQP